jgi:hypothetical protein
MRISAIRISSRVEIITWSLGVVLKMKENVEEHPRGDIDILG